MAPLLYLPSLVVPHLDLSGIEEIVELKSRNSRGLSVAEHDGEGEIHERIDYEDWEESRIDHSLFENQESITTSSRIKN
ncbi:hypothetical protein L1887_23531 [Cichorium endivia]|nr:hypothetical protein L1887_23531 [Cichorium endivia]